jgi:hypothetical protein
MAKFAGVRQGSTLKIVDDEGREAIRSLRVNTPVMIEVKQSRSVRQHRLWWGMVRKVHDNLPEKLDAMWPRPENLSKAILERLGYVDELKGLDGKIYRQVQSISFDKMDSMEFNSVMEAAIGLVIEVIIPGIDRDGLMDEILEMIS